MTSPKNRMRPVHPGEILREDYLAPLEMSAHALAMALSVPATRIHEIVNERRGISRYRRAAGTLLWWRPDIVVEPFQATYDLKTLPTRKEIMRRVQPHAA